ncbi:MAG TPA: Holliday junction resolvase RuvX [Candidatus Binataceae bacterium]|nr:Holliday junction resolvase RuvX [Candidatus Binataceae bacterium]
MAIIAIDFGKRRIGLAIAESADSVAYPLGTITRVSWDKDLKQLRSWISSRAANQLVVGLPLNMDGSEGPSARAARTFGEQLAAHLHLPVDYADERLTSFEARERLPNHGPKRRRKTAVDAVAATIILEEWLAAHRNSS